VPVLTMLQALAAAADSVADDTAFAHRIVHYAQTLAPYAVAQRDRSHDRAQSGNPRSVTNLTASIERLVRERRLGSAMALVDQLQPLLFDQQTSAFERPTIEDARAVIAALHPPAGPADEFTAADIALINASTAITITPTAIPSLLASLPTGSAAGVSGWTYSAIKSLFSSTDATTNDLLAKLLNRMLSGRLTSDLWLFSRSVLIPKSSGGYRPLGIGDAWYRIAARAALFQLGPEVGRQFSPLQNGIGIPGGCEIGGRIGQLIMSAPPALNLILTSTDFKNGFNLPGRSHLLRALQRIAPGLLRWFQWTHGHSTQLFQDGTRIGWSATGCRQGDPLSSLIFCAYIHPILQRFHVAMQTIIEREVPTAAGIPPPVFGIYAFIDDVTFYYDGAYSSRIEAAIRDICEEEGILLNLSKCYHLVRDTSVLDTSLPHLFTLKDSGERILGAPAGTSSFRQEYVASKVDSAVSSLPALATLQPWTIWHLLRSCITARLAYMARVLEPPDTAPAFSRFDQHVDAIVGTMTHADSDEERFLLQWLRCLPLDLNGLGLPRYCGLAGDTACLLSRELTYNFLEAHNPELLVGITELWLPVKLGAVEEQLFLAPARAATAAHFPSTAAVVPTPDSPPFFPISLPDDETFLPTSSAPDALPVFEPLSQDSSLSDSPPVPSLLLASGEGWVSSIAWDPNATPETRRLARSVGRNDPSGPRRRIPRARPIRHALYRRLSVELIHYLHRTGRKAHARWMRGSCYKGSGRWLQGPGGAHFYGRLAFRNKSEYRAALRMRLLFPAASPDVGDASGVVHCSCGQHFSPKDQPFHAIDCRDSQWHHIQRHNLVRDLVLQFLRKHCDDRVEPEPAVGRRNGTEITVADNLAEADARRTSQRLARRLSSVPVARPVTQPVSAFAAERARQLRDGHFRADLGILSPTRRIVIDVAVGNPAAVSYASPPPGYHPPPSHVADPTARNYAIEYREAEKLHRYRRLLGAAADDPSAFVPFVITATGFVSPRAVRFLQTEIFPTRSSTTTRACTDLFTQLSAAVVRYNAMAALAWMRRLIAARTQL
jgi:hypothetical protein